MSFAWPASLAVLKCDPQLRGFEKTGGRATGGRQQSAFFDAGYMEINYTLIVNTPARLRAYRAFISRLRAGEEVQAEIFERAQAIGAFNLDTGVTCAANALLRDTTLSITSEGIKVEAGIYIGIGNRCHVVTSVTSGGDPAYPNPISGSGPWIDSQPWSDASPSPTDYITKILPPLRSNCAAGTAIKLRGITMLGKLADVSQGDTDLDLLRRGTVSFIIRESI